MLFHHKYETGLQHHSEENSIHKTFVELFKIKQYSFCLYSCIFKKTHTQWDSVEQEAETAAAFPNLSELSFPPSELQLWGRVQTYHSQTRYTDTERDRDEERRATLAQYNRLPMFPPRHSPNPKELSQQKTLLPNKSHRRTTLEDASLK